MRNISNRNERQVSSLLHTFVQDHVRSPDTFVSEIDENDEMFLFDLQRSGGDRVRTSIGYYKTGLRICDSIKQIVNWNFGAINDISSFLDFASGYGRSTRFLAQELAPDRIWACDIYPDAVEFQRRRYGVNGIVSVADPADFPTDMRFDCIFASSFFSHIPESTFIRWIQRLYSLLTPRGLLIFSVHDMSLLNPADRPARTTGMLFFPQSESRTLDKDQYGTSYVDEAYVTDVAARASRGKAHLHRIERGLCHFQDLYILADRPSRGFSGLDFAHHPEGCVDACQSTPDGGVHLTGWAADLNPFGSINGIELYVDGKLTNRVFPAIDRPDVAEYYQNPTLLRSGWSCHLERNRARLDSILAIKITNTKNLSNVILFDTLGNLVTLCAAAG